MAKLQLVWRTEKRRVNDLLPYEKNPRVITDAQMEDLKKSLQKFNLAELPAINTDGKIAAGHQRIKALQLLGRGEELIEIRIPNRKLTTAEFKQYLLISNRSGGTWDWNILESDFDIGLLLETGFDSDDLSKIFDDNLEVSDDDFDEETELEKIKTTDIKLGDMFALGRHRLICGDALNPETVKKLMGGGEADMIDIDPPFNIKLDYNKGVGGKGTYGGKTDDSKTDKEYRTFLKTIMHNALSATKKDAHVFFWCDERYVWLLQGLYRELGLDSKRLCIWIKDNFSPTPKSAFNKATEYCVYGTRGKPYLSDKVRNLNEVMNKEMGTGNKLSDDILDQLNIWMVKRVSGAQMEHPTQKSPTLHEKALRRCTRPGDIVLDLTAGSGSILSACEQLKRTAFLCEFEPIFCQLIINRFKKISHEKVTKLN
jgi:DNA modification methylase